MNKVTLRYSPKPVTAYFDGWYGPGSAFRDAPELWNLAWLLLPNVDTPPKQWRPHPIEDDIINNMSDDLFATARWGYPLQTVRHMQGMADDHPFKANWTDQTLITAFERARGADARLRSGQALAAVVKVDFASRRRA